MITFCNNIVIDFNELYANILVYRQDCLTIFIRRFEMNLSEGWDWVVSEGYGLGKYEGWDF